MNPDYMITIIFWNSVNPTEAVIKMIKKIFFKLTNLWNYFQNKKLCYSPFSSSLKEIKKIKNRIKCGRIWFIQK